MCSCMYVELHAHSAFSFLDGASLPDELAARRGRARLRGVRADRPQRRVAARWSSRRPPRALGLRAIHGAEIDLDGRPPPHAAGRGRDGLAQPLPDRHARARARRATSDEPPPAVPLETLEEHAAGLVCLSGCARQGVHDEPTLRRLLAAFGRRPPARRAAAPVPARRPRAQPRRWPSWRERLGRRRRWRPATSTRTRARARRCRTRSSPCATTRRSTPPSPCGAATSPTCSPRRRRWRRASRTTRDAVAETRRAGRPAALRPHASTSATATRARRTPSADRTLAELCWPQFDERYPPGSRATRDGARRAWRRSCG